MKRTLILAAALLALPLLLAACGGNSEQTPAEQTFEADMAIAEKTPVEDYVRDYASQLCDPLHGLLEHADLFTQVDEQTPEDFGEPGDLFSQLRGPMEDFHDDLDNVDPPDELRAYHDSFVGQFAYFLQVIDAVSEAGIFGAFALDTPEPTPEDPPGFEAAIAQECGEDMKDLVNQFGADFFSDEDGSNEDAPSTPPPAGQVGEATTSGDFELTVNSFVDPYPSDDPTFQPPSGQRWVLVDVSLRNVSTETKDYASFDFTLRDADSFSYDTTFIGQAQDLSFGSLRPDETIHGTLGFELSVDSLPARLVFEPGFTSEGRIDIELR